MARGRKLDVCAEQNTLDINRDCDRAPNAQRKNRAGVPGDNMYKDGQTLPQALATVADDERVGRIDHTSLDTVQLSQLGDIHQVSTLIVFLERPSPIGNLCGYLYRRLAPQSRQHERKTIASNETL